MHFGKAKNLRPMMAKVAKSLGFGYGALANMSEIELQGWCNFADE